MGYTPISVRVTGDKMGERYDGSKIGDVGNRQQRRVRSEKGDGGCVVIDGDDMVNSLKVEEGDMMICEC